jgi:hypothetical protein
VKSTFATGLNLPAGMAFDSTGNMFVGITSGTVVKITPDGMQSTFASGFPNNNNFYNNSASPRALAFEPVPQLVAAVTNSVFQIAVSMPSPYFSTIVQASPDLVNWVNIYTNTPPFTLTDSMATTGPHFYRALLGP